MLLVDQGDPCVETTGGEGSPSDPLAVAVWPQRCLRQSHDSGMPCALGSLCAKPGLCSEMLKLVLPGQGRGCLLESLRATQHCPRPVF